MSSYATVDDLAKLGLPPGTLDDVDEPTQEAQLDAASSVADSYLAARFNLPLVAPYTPDLVSSVCAIAAWRLLARRGFNPESGSHLVVRQLFEDAMRWLRDISQNKAHPQVKDSAPASGARAPRVVSKPSRGW